MNVTLKVNGQVVAEGTVPITTPIAFTANECLDFGIALGSPVSLDYYDKAPFKFNGTIERAYVGSASYAPLGQPLVANVSVVPRSARGAQRSDR